CPSCAGPTRWSCSSTTTGVSSTPAWSSTETTAGAPTAGAPGPGWSWRWGRRCSPSAPSAVTTCSWRWRHGPPCRPSTSPPARYPTPEHGSDRQSRPSGPRRPFHHEDPVAGHSVEHLGCRVAGPEHLDPLDRLLRTQTDVHLRWQLGLVGPTAGDPARHRSSI